MAIDDNEGKDAGASTPTLCTANNSPGALLVPVKLPRHGLRTRMILTVHDELLFESPRDEVEAAAAIVRERMENVMSLSVPLTVDVGIAENWRDAKP